MRRPSSRARVLLLLAFASGCITDLQRQAVKAFEQGSYEEAIASLEQAVQDNPRDPELRLELRTRRDAAVQQLLATAESARANGNGEAAAASYRRVLAIDRNNYRALLGLQAVEADQRHAERTAKATQLFAAKKLDAAEIEVRAVLAEDPGFAPANVLLGKIDLARGPVAVVPRLRTRDDRPVTLQFRDAPTKMVFEALARQTGLNFVFDKDVKGEGKTTIFVDQVPVEQAIDLILAQNQLGRLILSDNIVMIYPDTAAKQREYRNEIVHTFYLTNAAPKDAEALLKTVLGSKTLFVDERSSTVVMRDTPERVKMAAKLVASLDVPEPEVIMEVEVLEITHSLAEQLGINYPNNIALQATKPPDSTGGSGAGLVLSDIAKQTTDTIAVSSLGISVDLSKSVGVANLLSTPRIRARNKEKAKILVGDRVPVVTSGTSATTGGSFSTSNVQYIDVGLTLEVQPTIHNDGNVAIKVGLEVSSIVKQISVPIGNGGSTLAYQIGTRNASTLLQLKDGETQVLGGLIQDIDHHSSSHIPGLGDLPVLGRLFGSTNKAKDKNEIVLSITPRIIRAQPRPAVEVTEFWYGSETQSRSAPYGNGPGGPEGPGPGPAPQGGVSFGGGGAAGAATPRAQSGPRAVPQRIEAGPGSAAPAPAPPAAGAPPPPDAGEPPPPDAGAAPPGNPADTSVTPDANATGASRSAEVVAGATAGAAAGATAGAAVGAAAGAAGGGAAAGAAGGAADKPRVTIEGPDTAKVGDELNVAVKLAAPSGLARIRAQVGFDASALQLLSADPGDLASGDAPKVDTRPGGVQLELAGSEGPTSGSLVNLRFRVIAPRPAIKIATQVVLVGEGGVAVAATQATPLTIAVAR